jgi:hypothetical protein
VDAGRVDHPRGLGELEHVPQLVAEERQAGVGRGIDPDCHADVAIAAARRQQVRGGSGGAEQTAAPHVDDEVRHRQTLEEGTERRRLLGPADDRRRQPRIVDAQERRSGRLRPRGRAAREQQRGHGERAPQGGTRKQSGQRR